MQNQLKDLIPIRQSEINSEKVNTVKASKLHKALGVETQYRDWIKRRIKEYNCQENQDFIISLKFERNSGAGRPFKEYHLTIDMAKELAMIEKTEMGRQVRQYFLQCEKIVVEQLKEIEFISVQKEKTKNLELGLQLEKAREELLKHNNLWKDFYRYFNMGLTYTEMERLTGLDRSTIRRHRRRMEACGVIKPPTNIFQMRQRALPLMFGRDN